MMSILKPILLAVLIALGFVVNAKDRVTLTNGEWPPFLGKQLPHYGASTHIVSEALMKAGIEVKYEFYAWPRAYNFALQGLKDGSVIWVWTEDRDKHFYFSDSILESEDVFFYLKSANFDWQGYEDLGERIIGASSGYSYGAGFDLADRTGLIVVERVTSEAQNFMKLISGKIDLVVANYHVGWEIIRTSLPKRFRERITSHKKPVDRNSWKLILSKKVPENEERMKQFNAALIDLKKTGYVDKVYQDALAGKYSFRAAKK